jgi:N-acetylglucosaminyl-diphospho-decaprenol L-rhamnosyltransferase
MIHVLIPVHNRVKLTINCINSLCKQSNFSKLNIIVIDDGSKDETAKIIKKKFSQITVLKGSGNLFWGGSIFLGISYILKIKKKNDFLLIVNNDVELASDAIGRLVNTCKENKRKAILGSIALFSKNKSTVIKSGTIIKNWFFNITHHVYEGCQYDEIKNKKPIEVDILTGRCLLHPIEIFEKIGNYDNKNFNHYGADDEFSLRAKKNNYLVLLCPASKVFLKLNELKIKNNFSLKYIFYVLFDKRSSSNVFNKFKLTLKHVPIYAKFTFFIFAVAKSLVIFFINSLFNQNK